MGAKSKQFAIYLGLLLICSTYTLIAPFYPKIAKEKGIPIWVVGIVFALNPFGNLVTTFFVGRILNKLGRKNVIISSYFFTALSLVLLSPIEYLDRTYVIIFSFASRLVAGVGSCCLFTTVTTIFTSDYPDQIQIMIGRMEACIGLGLIIGPMLGTGLYSINLFIAMPCLAAFILMFSPLAWKMLGTFQNYLQAESNIKRGELFLKPKIYLTLCMSVSFLFSFGFLASMLEEHLNTYGFDTLYVSLCFAIQSTIYFIFSLTAGYIFRQFDPRLIMLTGQMIMVLAFLLLGPWSLIFPNSVWVVLGSLPLFALAQNMTFVFTIGFMIDKAVNEYGYHDDDILVDTISSFSTMGCSFGEIIGPVFAGFVTEFYGIENCCLYASILSFIFAIVYSFGTGLIFDIFKTRKSDSLIGKDKVVPENISLQKDAFRDSQ